jgi:hypothetical protein
MEGTTLHAILAPGKKVEPAKKPEAPRPDTRKTPAAKPVEAAESAQTPAAQA